MLTKMKVTNVIDFVEILRNNEIVIYGAGYVASEFYHALKQYGISDRVKCFVISEGMGQELEGIPVIVLDKLYDKDSLICIAVHESVKNEIIEKLDDNGFKQYIWIYPFINKLILGFPVCDSKRVEIKKIMLTCLNDYRMPMRYLAIDNYYGINEQGYQIYKKVEAIHCSKKTAEKRLEQYKNLIEVSSRKGFDTNNKIAILEDFNIIDGNHRVAVASYFGIKEILCEVYENTRKIEDIHTHQAMLTKGVLEKADLDEKEFELLESARRKIEAQYNES